MSWLSWGGSTQPTLNEVLQSMAEISSEKVSVSTGTFSSQPWSCIRWLKGDSCDTTVDKILKVIDQIQFAMQQKAPPPLYWKAAQGLVRLVDAYENETEKQKRILDAVKKYLRLGDQVPNSSVGGEYILITLGRREKLFELFPSYYVEEKVCHGMYFYTQNASSLREVEWEQMTEQQWRDLIDSSLGLLSELHKGGGAHGAIDETAVSVVGLNRQVVFSLTDRIARPKLEMDVQKGDVCALLTLLYQKRFPEKQVNEAEISQIITALGRLSENSRPTYRCIFNRFLGLSSFSQFFPFPLTERLRPLKITEPPSNKGVFVERLLTVVQTLHSRELSHGSIKPDCIFWNNDRLTVEDFEGPTPIPDRTYGAPESLAAFKARQLEVRTSKEADIWSLGAVLYELYFPPLSWMHATGTFEVLEQAFALKASSEGYPAGKSDLEKLLLAMMNPDPGKRPAIGECLKRFKACKPS